MRRYIGCGMAFCGADPWPTVQNPVAPVSKECRSVNTANSIRALLLVLTFAAVPAACFAQASDNQTPDSPGSDNQAPNYPTPDNQAPNYQTSDSRTSDGEVSAATAQPPLPSYAQPPVPGPGYLWTPGFWAYGVDVGYYWVPGTW